MFISEAVESGINMLSIDGFVVLSNVALVIVTAFAVIVGLKENNRHEEHNDDMADRSEERLAKIIHQVIEQDHADEQKENTHDAG